MISMVDIVLKFYDLEGMLLDILGVVNKYGNINNFIFQVSVC